MLAWGKAIPKALEEDDLGLLTRPSIQAAGLIFGLPTGQVEITLGNVWDYATGQSDFELRDLFFRIQEARK